MMNPIAADGATVEHNGTGHSAHNSLSHRSTTTDFHFIKYLRFDDGSVATILCERRDFARRRKFVQKIFHFTEEQTILEALEHMRRIARLRDLDGEHSPTMQSININLESSCERDPLVQRFLNHHAFSIHQSLLKMYDCFLYDELTLAVEVEYHGDALPNSRMGWRPLHDFLMDAKERALPARRAKCLVNASWMMNFIAQCSRVLHFLHANFIFMNETLHENNIFVDHEGNVQFGDYGVEQVYEMLGSHKKRISLRTHSHYDEDKLIGNVTPVIDLLRSVFAEGDKGSKDLLRSVQYLQSSFMDTMKRYARYDMWRFGTVLLKTIYVACNYSLPEYRDFHSWQVYSPRGHNNFLCHMLKCVPDDAFSGVKSSISQLLSPIAEVRPSPVTLLEMWYIKQYLHGQELRALETIFTGQRCITVGKRWSANFSSLKRCLKSINSSVGTVIIVEEGTYKENVVINKDSIAIIGRSGAVIRGSLTFRVPYQSAGKAVEIPKSINDFGPFMRGRSLVRGLRIENHDNREDAAAVVFDGGAATLIDCEVQSQRGNGIVVSGETTDTRDIIIQCNHIRHCGQSGVVFSAHSNGLLSSNKVYDCGEDGIDIQGGASPHVAQNSIFNNASHGISIKDGSYGARIEHNEIYGNGRFGVYTIQDSVPIVEHNAVHRNGDGGICLSKSLGKIKSNKVNSNNGNGIQIEQGSNPLVTCNSVFSNKGTGITIQSKSQGKFTHNEIYDNEENGIQVLQYSDPLIAGGSIRCNGGAGIDITSSSTGVYRRLSIESNAAQGIKVESHSKPAIKKNHISSVREGIFIDTASASVENNLIVKCGGIGGVKVRGTGSEVTLIKNEIRACHGASVMVSKDARVEMIGNQCKASQHRANLEVLSGGKALLLGNNSFTMSRSRGLDIHDGGSLFCFEVLEDNSIGAIKMRQSSNLSTDNAKLDRIMEVI